MKLSIRNILEVVIIAMFALLFSKTGFSQQTFTINSLDDAGAEIAGDGTCSTGKSVTINGDEDVDECTLRAALEEANAAGDATIIDISEFIPLSDESGGFSEIVPNKALPAITKQVVINGESHPLFLEDDEIPKLIIDGKNAGDSSAGLHLADGADHSEIRYLTIGNFSNDGIRVHSAGDVSITGNHIGITENSELSGNSGNGLQLLDGISEIHAENNTIVDSGNNGLYIMGSAEHVTLTENKVGVFESDQTFKTAGNAEAGIYVTGDVSNLEIGSCSSGECAGNYVSGNKGSGIVLRSDQVEVKSNWVGVDPEGSPDATFGNQSSGILINADDVVIGGDEERHGNVIGNSGQHGIITLQDTQTNRIVNNRVGILESGEHAGNQNDGIWLNGDHTMIEENNIAFNGSEGVHIKQDERKENEIYRNTIHNNTGHGILFNGSGIIGGIGNRNYINQNGEHGISVKGDGVKIYGNYIGTDDDYADRGNGKNGILLDGSDITVGGVAYESRNVIAYNQSNGIGITSGNQNIEIRYNGIGTSVRGLEDGMGNGASGIETVGKGLLITGNQIKNHEWGVRQLGESLELKGNIIMDNDYGFYTSKIARIGGTEEEERNIFGNNKRAIRVSSSTADVEILGNVFGINENGRDAGNETAIFLDAANNVKIGNTKGYQDNSAANIFVNNRIGIELSGTDSTEVRGNYFGVNREGEVKGNSDHAIYVNGFSSSGTFNSTIGYGPEEDVDDQPHPEDGGFGNIIAHSGSSGILLDNEGEDFEVLNHTIRGNLIYGNSGKGIELRSDPEGSVRGANRLLDYPVIDSYKTEYNETFEEINYSYQIETDEKEAEQPLVIDFYLVEDRERQGKTYLGMDIVDDLSVQKSEHPTKKGTLRIPDYVQVSTDDYIVATATDGDGNTSEFSKAIPLSEPAELRVNSERVDFGTVQSGKKDTVLVELENSGVANLIGEFHLTDDTDEGFTLTDTDSEFNIPSGKSFVVEVVFDPKESGEYSGGLQVSHDAANEESPVTLEIIAETVLPVPGVVELASPADGSDDQPNEVTLEWDGAEYAETYRVQLSEEGSMEQPLIDSSGVSDSGIEILDELEGGITYEWRVRAVNGTGDGEWSEVWKFSTEMATSVAEEFSGQPEKVELQQNYPNPFNPSTEIRFGLPETAIVRLAIYNTLGREVAVLVDEQKSAGWHVVSFDASGLSSGTYLYRIQAGDFRKTATMTLIK